MKHWNKNFHRALTLAVLATALVGTTAAVTGSRTIQVDYMDIKVVVDGHEVVLKDGAGNSVEPFASNGTTYLPVRVVGEALGKEVSWDPSTNTVYIGDAAYLPYQVNGAVLYDGKDASASFSVAGREIKLGTVLRSYHTTNSIREGFDAFDGSAIWNTDGYQTMTFTVGHVGDCQQNATLYISLDGISGGEYALRWDGSPQTITVPLGGSPNVKLTLISEPTDYYTSVDSWREAYISTFGVYDVKLDK